MQPPKDFYLQDAAEVARQLIGKLIVSTRGGIRVSGRIVETEAYLGSGDEASHAFRGQTLRNAAMFGPAGHVYIYFTYGMHHCMNIVCAPNGVAEAVLIRALEPVEGIETMVARRKTELITNLASGPGKLVQALGVTKADDGVELSKDSGIWIEDDGKGMKVMAGPRIGISRAADLPLRFWATDNPYVSKLSKHKVR